MSAVIELAPSASENGLAMMLADLLRQNLDDHPHKLRDFEKLNGRVAIVAEDAKVALTLDFQRGKLVLHDGILGVPHITVRANSDDVMNMSLMELTKRFALPDPRGAINRVVFEAMKHGRIQSYGAFLHIPFMLRLTRVMSVN